MRILLTSESYWPKRDGGAQFQHRLAHQLVDHGETVAVWAQNDKNKFEIEHDGPVTTYREASSAVFYIDKSFQLAKKQAADAHVSKVFEDFKPDLIHVHGVAWIGTAAIRYAKEHKIPIVATNHFMPENGLDNSSIPRSLHQGIAPVIWKVLVSKHQNANLVIAPTQTAADYLVQYGLEVPQIVVTNGVDVKTFKPQKVKPEVLKKYDIPVNDNFMLYLGRLDQEKRLDLLLESFAQSKTKHKLVIAGRGIGREGLERIAEELKISERVVFAGSVDEEDKPKLFAAATIFGITSPAELQSIVCLEALASGTPVIAMDRGAIHELCQDYITGRLIPWGDTVGFAKAIDDLFDSPKDVEQYSDNARTMVVDHHSQELSLELHLNAYKQVLENS